MRQAGCIAGLLALVAVAPAQAADATATLEIVGEISPRCSISLREVTIGRVLNDGPGGEHVDFAVDCNQRLTVNMRSLYGGLQHEAHDRLGVSPGFISFLPYTASFEVAAPGASPVVFRSEEMIGGATGSIGVAPYKAQGRLNVNWTPEAHLIGGAYSDVIEIRVSGEGETSSLSSQTAG